MSYIIRLIVSGLIIYFIPSLLSGVVVDSYITAIIVAFVMSILNGIVKPVLVVLSLPITVLTLGLFYLVITVAIVYLCDFLVGGFAVNGFFTALIFSFILSIANSIIGGFQD
ncbi:MAG: putative membrane protein [Spirosomataceae bacterium]|jgi:putative membrane protein